LFQIKKNNIRKKTAKLADKLANRQVIVRPVRNVAVLNNPDSNLTFENLKFVQKTLNLSDSQFDILTFKNKRGHYNELRGIVASKSFFSSFGKLKSPETQKFLNKDYDLLLDFTGMSNIYERFLSLSIKANCRVGYYNDEELYDIMVQVPKGDIKNFILEATRYLKLIGLLS